VRNSLVAINIVNDNKLLNINGNGVPLLFYWNGEDEVLDSIFKMDIFKAKIYDVINDVNNYANSKIALFYFKYIEDKEQYNELSVLIQDYIKLKDFPEDKIDFYKEYIWQHFAYLYKSVYQEDYDKDINMLSIEDSILDIYDKIKEKHPKRVMKSTVLNYVRSELMKTNHLNMDNTDWIINKLDNLLNERE